MKREFSVGRILCGAVVVAALSGCAAGPAEKSATSVGALQIVEYQSGLLRQCGTNCWEISEPGQEFDYRVNGRCKVGEVGWQDCMWHGWMIRYVAVTDVTTMECEATYSQPVNVSSAYQSPGKAETGNKFPITLKGRRGTRWVPNYVAGDRPPPEHRTMTLEVICRYQGRDVVRHRMTVHEQPGPPASTATGAEART